MSKHELELVELTNMCMVFDEKTNKVLVQIRDKDDWDGISFPGGHVEVGEPFILSVIREVKEETGLDISNVIPCGFKDWYDFKKKKRYVVMFFKTSTFSGELISKSHEGINTWMSIQEIKASKTAEDFKEMLDIFLGESSVVEFFYEDKITDDESSRWEKKFY
ncbi:MAG: 8-oxo-dGTP diphosphatase [Bacilli bacterium]|nr:8-oxo-dGTP diphosphatase [Bacilli bacterium]